MIINEILQWAGIILLLLLSLGLFRQMAIMQPASNRAAGNGPEVGTRLPGRLLSMLPLEGKANQAHPDAMLAFVTENCTGCRRLLAALSEAAPHIDHKPILIARQPSAPFSSVLNETSLPVVVDEDGSIWAACGITATPLVVEVNERGTVVRKEVTARVESLLESH